MTFNAGAWQGPSEKFEICTGRGLVQLDTLNTAQHKAVQHQIAQCKTKQRKTAQHKTAQRSTQRSTA